MAKGKIEEEEDFPDEEDVFEEDEEEAPPIKPKRPVEVARTNKFAPQPKPAPENRYQAIHSPAIDGIMDKTTDKLVNSGDLWQELADIKSALHRIEENLG